MKFEEYIECYDRKFRDLMDDKLSNKPLEYHGSVWTTWTISFDSIKSDNDTGIIAANLLILWSCLDNKNIRQELFFGAKFDPEDILPSWTKDIAYNVHLEFSRAIQLLRRYSMVEEVGESESHSIHPVVHKWIYHYRYDEIRKAMGRTATILLFNTLKLSVMYDKVDAQNRMIPHIKARRQKILEEEQTQVRDKGDNDKLKNEFARNIAYASAKKALFSRYDLSEELHKLRKEAEEQLQRVQVSGRPYDHKTLQIAKHLFFIYLTQDTPKKAIQLGEQIVERLQKSPDSGSKLTAMQTLGELYLHQGMIREATSIIAAVQQECDSRSLPIDLLMLDLMFAKTVLLSYEDKIAEAVATMESVQEQTRNELGPAHELSLLAIYRLGSLYSILSQPKKIEMLSEQVKEMSMGSTQKMFKHLREFLEIHENLAYEERRASDLSTASRAKEDTHNIAKWFFKFGRHLDPLDSPRNVVDEVNSGLYARRGIGTRKITRVFPAKSWMVQPNSQPDSKIVAT